MRRMIISMVLALLIVMPTAAQSVSSDSFISVRCSAIKTLDRTEEYEEVEFEKCNVLVIVGVESVKLKGDLKSKYMIDKTYKITTEEMDWEGTDVLVKTMRLDLVENTGDDVLMFMQHFTGEDVDVYSVTFVYDEAAVMMLGEVF